MPGTGRPLARVNGDGEEGHGLHGVFGKGVQAWMHRWVYSAFCGGGLRSLKQMVSSIHVAQAGEPSGKNHCPRSQAQVESWLHDLLDDPGKVMSSLSLIPSSARRGPRRRAIRKTVGE